jgi:hypothetical protein
MAKGQAAKDKQEEKDKKNLPKAIAKAKGRDAAYAKDKGRQQRGGSKGQG